MNNFALGFLVGFLTLTKEGKEIQQQAIAVGGKALEEFKKFNDKANGNTAAPATQQQQVGDKQ